VSGASQTVPDTPPPALTTLVERFDPAAFDQRPGGARLRLTVTGAGAWDVGTGEQGARLERAPHNGAAPDAALDADAATWEGMARDVRGGMEAFRRGRLRIRNLHLGVGFLAATSGDRGPGRLRMERARTETGSIAMLTAGQGEPVVTLHGLGGTKASFLPTLAQLAPYYRVIAVDLPGFGDSSKPVGASYHAPFFARATVEVLDALEIEHAHLIGNSMGGRVALEVGMRYPDRASKIALLAPSLAWLRQRRWAPLVRVLRPELSLVQAMPRSAVEAAVRRLVPGADDGWVKAGVDEFLRSFVQPRGRAAFLAAARQIYLEEPRGPKGFWTRLASLAPESLFVWGRQDQVVPIRFARHVKRELPSARHVELDCGHVPQLERPRETHAAIRDFLTGGTAETKRAEAAGGAEGEEVR
jgi:pimeloyl-ACP methyl ester carboxylesterase